MLALATDSEFWARWFGIVMVDLLLAGDNAIVIAMAVRLLPRREQMLGRVWGTFGAVGLRILFIALVDLLLKVPLVHAIGGLALLWVAWKLLPTASREVTAPEGEAGKIGGSLGESIRIIIIADVSMSLDNVLAVAATAHGDLLLVICGIALTIPLVVWGSSLLSLLMTRLPFLLWFGCGILGYVAGMLLVEDPQVRDWLGTSGDPHRHPLAFGLAALFVGLAWWRSRRARPRRPTSSAR